MIFIMKSNKKRGVFFCVGNVVLTESRNIMYCNHGTDISNDRNVDFTFC